MGVVGCWGPFGLCFLVGVFRFLLCLVSLFFICIVFGHQQPPPLGGTRASGILATFLFTR